MKFCFAECENININDKSVLKINNCTNMDYAFYKDDLYNVNFSFLDIRNVESMKYCFAECKKIKINDKSVLKIGNCNNMNYTFYKTDLNNVNFSFIDSQNEKIWNIVLQNVKI